MINFIDEVDNHMLIYGLVISHLIVHSCLMNQLQTKDQLLILNEPLYNFLNDDVHSSYHRCGWPLIILSEEIWIPLRIDDEVAMIENSDYFFEPI